MRGRLWLLPLLLLRVLMANCASSSDTCMITTAITPPNATADHNSTVPGNEVQFLLSSTVKGNCPLVPDFLGVCDLYPYHHQQSSSDPRVATCLECTPTPATISNSSTVRTKAYPSSSLVCK